jgi:hypothetical protein
MKIEEQIVIRPITDCVAWTGFQSREDLVRPGISPIKMRSSTHGQITLGLRLLFTDSEARKAAAKKDVGNGGSRSGACYPVTPFF